MIVPALLELFYYSVAVLVILFLVVGYTHFQKRNIIKEKIYWELLARWKGKDCGEWMTKCHAAEKHAVVSCQKARETQEKLIDNREHLIIAMAELTFLKENRSSGPYADFSWDDLELKTRINYISAARTSVERMYGAAVG